MFTLTFTGPLFTALGLALLASPSLALDDATQKALAELTQTQIKPHISSPEFIRAVMEQNKKTAKYTPEEINRLDTEWIQEYPLKARPVIEAVLNKPASMALKKIKAESAGTFTEIFLMDAKGLTVAASDATSDYWQGDEAKWKQTFLVGPDAIHYSEIELDKSTQKKQAQVSLPIIDPATKQVVGAITFGVSY